ncbi:MAG: hypothetical protein K2R98_25135 [Gemmataceae bacterium]|nr:hypothetical protein [Gemmataceae bacterium]
MEDQLQKRCGRCQVVKSITDFQFRSKGGRQGYCKPCLDEYKREYYLRNKEAYVDRAIKYGKRLKAMIREAKNRPCADCGLPYPYYVMEFDHRENEIKICNVGTMMARKGYSLGQVLAEIAKCDVVCANCHREGTHQRRQNCPKRFRSTHAAEEPPDTLL